MSLAAERTYLAYTRTALALLVAGVAVVGALPDAPHLALRRVLGTLVVLLGMLLGASAYGRWQRIERAMRRSEPLPRSRSAIPLTVGLVAAGVFALVLVIVP